MKLERIVSVQWFLVLIAVLAGVMLKNDLSEGPRMIHRLSGQLAGIAGIVVAVRVMQLKTPKSWKILAWASLAATFVAGLSGIMLKDTSNYDTTFLMMRVGGGTALLLSTILFMKTVKAAAKK